MSKHASATFPPEDKGSSSLILCLQAEVLETEASTLCPPKSILEGSPVGIYRSRGWMFTNLNLLDDL